MRKPKLEVGMRLWMKGLNRHPNRDVTVTAVGRKWAQLDNGRDRIDIDTWYVDGKGYTSPGRCYESKEDWEAANALDTAWADFRRCVDRQHSSPPELTVEAIQQAKTLLRLT